MKTTTEILNEYSKFAKNYFDNKYSRNRFAMLEVANKQLDTLREENLEEYPNAW